jgi:E3 ubiquitin-protein ligase listerin
MDLKLLSKSFAIFSVTLRLDRGIHILRIASPADIDKFLRPTDIIALITDGLPGLTISLLDDILPPRNKIDNMLNDFPSDVIHPSLAVLEPFIPPLSVSKNRVVFTAYDHHGYSSYARIVVALLHAFLVDRKLARENMWGLRHILALQLFANDFAQVPLAPNPVFDQHTLQSDVGQLISKCQQMATYLLTSSVEDGWHLQVVDSILKGNARPGTDALGKFVVELIAHSKSQDSVQEGRILRNVLQHIVNNADKQEADQWILLARKIEKSSLVPFRFRFFFSNISSLSSSRDIHGYCIVYHRICT